MSAPGALAIHRPALFAVGMLLLVGVPAPMVVTSLLPQETCDAFGPLMECPDGARPRCADLPVPGGRPHEKALSITCAGHERSAAPLYLAWGAISLVVLGASLPLIARALQSPRA